jgi:putative membrane protein
MKSGLLTWRVVEMGEWFLWLKAAHIISMVAWMAGLFYLPRLFVYHTRLEGNGDSYDLFCVMERRLLKAIMTPAALATVICGAILIFAGGYWPDLPGWLWLKLALVTGMAVFHWQLGRYRLAFSERRNHRSERYFRMINEVPTLLLIGVVILVVVRPW